jgi:membrane-anchored mycosin MYCP
MTRQAPTRRPMLAGTVTATLLALAAPTPAAAAPAGYCSNPPGPAATIEDVPWQVRAYDAPERLWPFSTGSGVTVAVLSTGVDADHPQLVGQVSSGADAAGGQGVGNADCVGIGTAAASVIAGQKIPGVGFYGLAPDAQIVPVRVSVDLSSGADNAPEPKPDVVADAINASVGAGADIVLVAHALVDTTEKLKNATAAAIAAGRVVVAPVGDAHPTELDPLQPTPAQLMPYPAGYPGVIGVGAVGTSGQKAPSSQIGEYVDLVAPGVDVVAAATQGQQPYTTTTISASYAAATVALMLADDRLGYGALTGQQKVEEISARLMATASPNGGDHPMMGYGAGLLDPYRALNEPLGFQAPDAGAPFTPYQATDAEIAAAEAEAHSRGSFTAIAGFGALALVLGGFVIWTVRRVRSGSAHVATSVVPHRSEDDLPEFVPGSALFKPKSVED